MSSRARATQSRRPESKTDVRTAGRGANTSFTWRDRLAKPLLVSHHFRTRPAACTAAATALMDDSFDLGSLPIAKVLPSHNPKWCAFSIPRKPMEPNAAAGTENAIALQARSGCGKRPDVCQHGARAVQVWSRSSHPRSAGRSEGQIPCPSRGASTR